MLLAEVLTVIATSTRYRVPDRRAGRQSVSQPAVEVEQRRVVGER
jgi:hypothetical protein